MRRGRERRPRGDTLPLRHRVPPIPCATSPSTNCWRRVIQAANLLHAHGIGPERHRDPADAQRAGDILRAVGRRDRGRRQPGELLPRCLADRRHHEAGRRQGADRGRCRRSSPTSGRRSRRSARRCRASRCSASAAKAAAMPGVDRLRSGLRGPAGRRLVAPKTLERDTVAALFHTGGTTGTAQARRAHARRPGAGGVDQHADVRPRAGHGAAQPAAAVPCRRLDLRRRCRRSPTAGRS